MNERIKELIKQATTIEYGADRGFDRVTFDKEKFAELIVRECSNAVLNMPCYYNDYRSQLEEAVIYDCGRTVLEHFGVKE